MRVALVLVVLLAGCVDTAEPPQTTSSPATTPTASTPTTTTPASTPVTTTPGVWAGTVDVEIESSRASIRPGEEVAVTILVTNQRERSIWTNPEFVCSGSWDVRVRDASGAEVRVDDRDALGCPSTDTYTTEVRPGESVTALYTWDGQVRPSLGQAQPAPPGTYTFEGVVRYATEDGPSNGARGASGNASLKIEVVA